MIVIIMIIALSISIIIGMRIKKIRTHRLLKKMMGEYIKKNIRPENTFSFAELEAKYGNGIDDE